MKKTPLVLCLISLVFANQVQAVQMGSIADSLASEQYYIQRHRINEAWETTKGSPNVIVAVIDDGVYLNHPDLQDAIWTNKKEVNGDGKDNDRNGYSDDYFGWNFIDNSPEMTVKGAHGTMVAGIIGAQHNGFGIVGIAPNSKLMSLIACDDKGCPQQAIIKAIHYAADNGASIINLSLGKEGTYSYLSTDFNEAIDYAYSKNVFIVAAAGNGDIETSLGKDTSVFPVSPVCNGTGDHKVLGVAAATKQLGKIALWSNYGKCVQVSAAGEDIVSTAPMSKDNIQYYYAEASGTSFAAPIAAGIAALVRSVDRRSDSRIIDLVMRYSGYQGQNSALMSVDAYEAVTVATSTPDVFRVEPSQAKPGDWVKVIGKGITNVDLAFAFAGPTNVYIPKKDKFTTSASEVRVHLPSTMPNGLYTFYVDDIKLVDALQVGDPQTTGIPTDTTPAPTPKPSTPPPSDIGSDDWSRAEKDQVKSVNQSLVNRMKGKILLQVEAHGEAWYIDPVTGKKFYMKDGPVAYSLMRSFGAGISDVDLAKIPTGPNDKGVDRGLANRMKGKILLQVQQHGEAWYVNPSDGYRYYLKDGEAAYQLMRKFGTGIANKDLRTITVGSM